MGIVLSGAAQQKPFMSPEELVEKLLNKGVTFNYDYTQARAIEYLKKNNNYYELSSYRKNFTKGDDGKYIDLDFSCLVDLGIIDMLFRYQVMRMALDIEHFEKVKLLTFLKAKNDDGYAILESYKSRLVTESNITPALPNKLIELEREIDQNKSSIYCRDMITHVLPGQQMPVWVFLEVITFGRFRSFFEFCANKANDTPLIDESYRLKMVKSIRNAAGHSNCILNDLRLATSAESNLTHDLNRAVLRKTKLFLANGSNISHSHEPDAIQNDRLKEIITLFFVHSRNLPSDAMRQHYKDELLIFVARMNRHLDDYYKDNACIQNAFGLIKKLVENWY